MGDRMNNRNALTFCDVVEDCIQKIRAQERGGRLRITPTAQKYLATRSDREIATSIDGVTRPAVQRLLCSPTTFAEEE